MISTEEGSQNENGRDGSPESASDHLNSHKPVLSPAIYFCIVIFIILHNM